MPAYHTSHGDEVDERVMVARSILVSIVDEDAAYLAQAETLEDVKSLAAELETRVWGAVEALDEALQSLVEMDGAMDVLQEDVGDLDARLREAEDNLATAALPAVALDLVRELDGREGEDGADGAVRWIRTALGRLSRVDAEDFTGTFQDTLRIRVTS